MARRQGGTLSGFTPLSTPNAPTIDSVSTSIGSASVSFTAPSDAGDAAVTSYIVTAVDESTGASSGATGTESPISISPGGGTFKIRMQAVNDFGPGRLTEFDTGNVVYSGAELYAWGLNDDGLAQRGMLGDGTVIDRSSPVQIGALTTWSEAAAGNNHSLAIKTDGTLWAWGDGNNGRTGHGNETDKSSPVQVGSLTNWYQVAGGSAHSAAVKTDGTLWAWGNNGSGRLGDSTAVDKSSPVQIGALTNWKQTASGGDHTAAVKVDGTLWAWGFNEKGQLGQNNTISRSSPVQIGSLTNWVQVSAGSLQNTAAVKTDSTLWVWGSGEDGRIGDNAIINRSSPVQIGALTNWAQVSCGSATNVAVKTDGTMWTWGSGASGRLGDGTSVNKSSPVQVGALTNWSSASIGDNFGAAVKTDGTLWTWGVGASGQLGDNTTVSKSSPVQVGALTSWTSVSQGAGREFNLALLGVTS